MSQASLATPARHAHLDSAAIISLIGLTLLWGVNNAFMKYAMVGISPMLMTFLRSALAMLFVYLWCRYKGIAVFQPDGSLASGAVIGGLFGLEFVLIYAGMDLTSASRAVLMTCTMPFFLMVGAHFLLAERVTKAKMAGALIAFGGVAVVFFDELSLPSANAIYGDLLCLAAGAAWAATTLAIRVTRAGSLAPEKQLLYQLAGGALVAIPFMPFDGPLVRELSFLPIVSVIFQALVVSAASYLLWFSLIARYPATGLSSFAFLTPVFGVLFGGLLLDEPLTQQLFIGLGLVAIGLWLVNGTGRKNA